MTIDGRLPLGWRGIPSGNELRPAQEQTAVAETSGGVHHALGSVAEVVASPPRVHMAVLHHRELQNFHIAFPGVASPYTSLPDNQLTRALESNFSVLEKLNAGGGLLTLAAVRQIAGERMGESERQDHMVQLANAVLKRPRLRDAILDCDGCITRQTLEKASHLLVGNSDPAAFSHDPFQAKSNAEVVQAFKDRFDELRAPSQDRTVLFEKHRYVDIERLITMSKDPDETGPHGEPVLDTVTGLPRKRYSEEHVYLAKNLVERPGLVRALEKASANGSGLFANHKQGWLHNKSLDRWFEYDKDQKAR